MSKRILYVSAITMAAAGSAACGGSGGGPPPNASPAGIWVGTESASGMHVTGIFKGPGAEGGEFTLIRADGVQYTGTPITYGSSINVSLGAFVQFGQSFPDGSTSGGGTLTATVQPGATLSGTASVTTSAGTQTTEAFDLIASPLYNAESSLSTFSGNYTDSSTGITISISGSGAITAQDPANGCVLSGQVSIVNASYNVYSVAYQYESCMGSAAVLNGVNLSGLATLDTSVSPAQAILGVTATQTNDQLGLTLAQVLTLNRQ